MSNDSSLISLVSPKPTFGDRIRNVADQLRQESNVQIKATSRILGAAAKIAENHDQLIDEVVDMVEEDLDQQVQAQYSEAYTAKQLKQQFKKLGDAKTHFGIKATSWATLASKLNDQATPPQPAIPQPNLNLSQESVPQRLEVIEREIQIMRGDINQVLKLLDLIVEKLS